MNFLTSALVHEEDDETQTLLEVCNCFSLYPVVGEQECLANPDTRVAVVCTKVLYFSVKPITFKYSCNLFLCV